MKYCHCDECGAPDAPEDEMDTKPHSLPALREAVADSDFRRRGDETWRAAHERATAAREQMLASLPTLLDELEAARAVLESAEEIPLAFLIPEPGIMAITIDQAKWLAWQAAKEQA